MERIHMLPHTTAPASSRLLTSRRQAIALFAASLGSLLASHAGAEDTFVYGKDIDGREVTSISAHDTKFVVAIFVATDCPISNRYLPLLSRLAKQFAPRPATGGDGIRLWLVYPNAGDTLAAVHAHQSQYPAAASLPQLIAPDSRFLAHAKVHVTPEAAIFHADPPPGGSTMSQPVLWHGRIDDRYLTFGTQRPAATHHDLVDAVNAALAGRQPAAPAAPPVGCAILPRA
jgi:hypothetical protein